MRVTRCAKEFRERSTRYRRAGLSVGLVPTLGGLHAGHSELMRRARSECDRVLVTVYLNPTQFDSPADLAAYRLSEDADLETCRRALVDLVYVGGSEALLPEGFQTWVDVEDLTRRLCGASRQSHFRGVATVVVQLLHIAKPHRVYFGLKDFQQARVVERLVRDLFFDVEVGLVPTVREVDGLAFSSRNQRLSPAERAAAPALYRALAASRDLLLSGELRVSELASLLNSKLAEDPMIKVDYAEILDARRLAPFVSGRVPDGGGRDGVLIAAAVYLGSTRLIDNVWVKNGSGSRTGDR